MSSDSNTDHGRPKRGWLISAFLSLVFISLALLYYYDARFSSVRKAKKALLHSAMATPLPSSRQMGKVLDSVGTNAIPAIKSMLEAEDHPLEEKIKNWIQKQKIIPLKLITAETEVKCALKLAHFAVGVQELIPQLAVHLDHPNTGIAIEAAKTLWRLQPASVPVLIQGLTNSNLDVRAFCAFKLDASGTNAVIALPLLVDCLEKSAPRLQETALQTLGRLNLHPEICVPAIVKALRSNDESVRKAAANALYEFGPNAKAAVPELIRLIKETPQPKLWYCYALWKIDPEAAERILPRRYPYPRPVQRP